MRYLSRQHGTTTGTIAVDAREIRWRAERRIGELIQLQKETVGLNEGGLRRGLEKNPRDERPTLAEVGIDKNLADRARELAAIPRDEFEATIADWRELVILRRRRPGTRSIICHRRA